MDGTTEEAHPGVRALYQQGEMLLAGPVHVIALQEQAFARYRHTPAPVRALFAARGWQRMAGSQTRNPVHRAHEYIQKCALETMDGLYLHPLVGETKAEDIPASTRVRCYEGLLGVLPAAMRYAGPREAIFHALLRKNYGCSHFIVGRDHAGVGHYYTAYDAHRIFAHFDPAKPGITPMFFEHAFFCCSCGSMASTKTCPHSTEQQIVLSGPWVRQMLRAGQTPPPEFSRAEVAQVFVEAMQQP